MTWRKAKPVNPAPPRESKLDLFLSIAWIVGAGLNAGDNEGHIAYIVIAVLQTAGAAYFWTRYWRRRTAHQAWAKENNRGRQ